MTPHRAATAGTGKPDGAAASGELPSALPDIDAEPPSAREASARTERLARTHYENFTVGSLLIPRAQRQHVFNLYAFCRGVDDLGDEVGPSGEYRLRLLELWEAELDACYADGDGPRHWAFVALRESIRACALPHEPFAKLIEANRRDQTERRYATFERVLDYCDHSANPVGRLFLRIFGYDESELDALSDQTCSALQLANFWQDVRRDLVERERIYVPQDSWERFGVSEADFTRDRASEPFKRMVEFEVDRAEAMFERGWPLLGRVDGRIRTDLELFTRGGLAILKAIRRQDYDTLRARPVFAKRSKIALLLRLMLRPPWMARGRLPRFPATRGK